MNARSRVLTVLKTFSDDIVPTSVLLAAAYGSEPPQGVLMKLRIVINDLRARGHSIEETAWGYRLVSEDEIDALPPFDFLSMLRDGDAQGVLFGEVGP